MNMLFRDEFFNLLDNIIGVSLDNCDWASIVNAARDGSYLGIKYKNIWWYLDTQDEELTLLISFNDSRQCTFTHKFDNYGWRVRVLSDDDFEEILREITYE